MKRYTIYIIYRQGKKEGEDNPDRLISNGETGCPHAPLTHCCPLTLPRPAQVSTGTTKKAYKHLRAACTQHNLIIAKIESIT